SDAFDVLSGRSEAEIKITRSSFLAIVFPVESEEGFHALLEAIQKKYFDATHQCWAFRVRNADGEHHRSSDAGEPSGTAGRPILAALESAELFNAACVVVRYFGGTKLGTGGLARAYRDAAREALQIAPRERLYLYRRITVEAPFERLNTLYRLVAPPDVVLVEERFAETNQFVFDVRLSHSESFLKRLATERLAVILS
ncbi:MAG TPA: YigZ family protein, partial [Thermoanaerobaculia bacterium]